MSGTIIDYLIRQVSDEIDGIRDDVTTGAIKDWAEYKRYTGRIDGLKLALGHIRSALEGIEAEDSD